MGVIAKGIPRGCQGLSTPVSLGYPLSVFNKNSTLKDGNVCRRILHEAISSSAMSELAAGPQPGTTGPSDGPAL